MPALFLICLFKLTMIASFGIASLRHMIQSVSVNEEAIGSSQALQLTQPSSAQNIWNERNLQSYRCYLHLLWAKLSTTLGIHI